jgi:hypothetical protein
MTTLWLALLMLIHFSQLFVALWLLLGLLQLVTFKEVFRNQQCPLPLLGNHLILLSLVSLLELRIHQFKYCRELAILSIWLLVPLLLSLTLR